MNPDGNDTPPNKVPKTEQAAKERPVRMGRMSMNGLSLEDALRGAMQVPAPPAPAKGGRKKKAK